VKPIPGGFRIPLYDLFHALSAFYRLCTFPAFRVSIMF